MSIVVRFNKTYWKIVIHTIYHEVENLSADEALPSTRDVDPSSQRVPP